MILNLLMCIVKHSKERNVSFFKKSEPSGACHLSTYTHSSRRSNEVLDDISDKSYDISYSSLVPLYSQGQLALTTLGRIFALQCHILHEMYILKDANCDFLCFFLFFFYKSSSFVYFSCLGYIIFIKSGDIQIRNKNYYITTTIIRIVCKVFGSNNILF